jgi:hypothetical protein
VTDPASVPEPESTMPGDDRPILDDDGVAGDEPGADVARDAGVAMHDLLDGVAGMRSATALVRSAAGRS